MKKLLIVAGLILVFIACKKENDTLTIANEQELTQTAFANEETTKGFTFTAKSDWTATVKGITTSKGSGVSWLTLLHKGVETYSGGAGTFTMEISLVPNSIGQTRTATIEIISGKDKITISVTQSGTTGGGESGFVINATNVLNANSNIATVIAILPKTGKEIASVKYENGGFKLTLPSTVSDEYLRIAHEVWGELVSDNNAKYALVYFTAMNSTGEYLADFRSVSNEDVMDVVEDYIYVDKSFTVKGESEWGFEYDCSFKKGWNRVYLYQHKEDKAIMTTTKPSGKIFKWYFDEEGRFQLG